MFSYLFMLICGIYYPIQTLPFPFSLIARFIPITYFLEYFRTGFGLSTVFSHPLIKGFLLIVMYLILSLWLIRFAFAHAKRSGVIVRISE